MPDHSSIIAPTTTAFDWAEVRHILLTDNSFVDPEDPAGCMDMRISSHQVEEVQRCIKALYWGLKWANRLKINGGYASKRPYHRIFLIDDQHLIGVFDNRNSLKQDLEIDAPNPKTTQELIQLHHQGQGNIKTLIVFEKENLRLANSDERDRQSTFILEAVYPALAGLAESLRRVKGLKQGYQDQCLQFWNHIRVTENTGFSGSQLISSPNSWLSLRHDSQRLNRLLLHNSPLQFFCSTDSPLNLDLEDTDLKMLSTAKLFDPDSPRRI